RANRRASSRQAKLPPDCAVLRLSRRAVQDNRSTALLRAGREARGDFRIRQYPGVASQLVDRAQETVVKTVNCGSRPSDCERCIKGKLLVESSRALECAIQIESDIRSR